MIKSTLSENVVKFAVSGLTREQIKIETMDDILSIEFDESDFNYKTNRYIKIPYGYEKEPKASLKDGILTLEFEERPRNKIQIS